MTRNRYWLEKGSVWSSNLVTPQNPRNDTLVAFDGFILLIKAIGNTYGGDMLNTCSRQKPNLMYKRNRNAQTLTLQYRTYQITVVGKVVWKWMYKLRTYNRICPSWKLVGIGQSSLATNTMIAPIVVHFYRRASKLVVPTMTAAILLNFLRLKLRWTWEACPLHRRTTKVGERSSGKRKLGTTAGERRSRHAPSCSDVALLH